MDGRSIGNDHDPLLRNYGHGWVLVDQNGNPVVRLSGAARQSDTPTSPSTADQPLPEDNILPITTTA
jgi:hypothetical protein